MTEAIDTTTPAGRMMMQQVLAELEWQGRLTVTEADLRALTPLKWQHINPYGPFTLNMHERLPLEGQLHNPSIKHSYELSEISAFARLSPIAYSTFL